MRLTPVDEVLILCYTYRKTRNAFHAHNAAPAVHENWRKIVAWRGKRRFETERNGLVYHKSNLQPCYVSRTRRRKIW